MLIKRLGALLVSALAASALAGGTAAATNWMTISPAGSISAPSTGAISFSAGGVTVRCNMTLTGSLDIGVLQQARDPFGAVSRVQTSSCVNGEIESAFALPWTTGFSAVQGVYPIYTGLLFNLLEATIPVRLFGGAIRCVYRGDVGALLGLSGSGPLRSGSLSLTGNAVPLREGALCPASGTTTGSFSLTPAQQMAPAQDPNPNVYSTNPAEALVPNDQRFNVGSVRVGQSGWRDLAITAVQGAWRMGPCVVVDNTYFALEPIIADQTCGRLMIAARAETRTRVLRVIFTPGNVANMVRSTVLQEPPIPNIRLVGTSVP